jgi:hypothetical protein
MYLRLTFLAAALAAGLSACATPLRQSSAAPLPITAEQAIGRTVEDVLAAKGPASQEWDLPDGRRVYQWQEISVMARMDSANGELTGAASQTTCFYTLYAQRDEQGRYKIVGFERPGPGCLKFAMNAAGM